jgi:hypothetical protein
MPWYVNEKKQNNRYIAIKSERCERVVDWHVFVAKNSYVIGIMSFFCLPGVFD